MAIGRIVRLMPDSGLGFVRETGATDELYFHWTDLVAGSLDQLSAGQLVAFERSADPREPARQRAINVQLIDETA